MTAKTKKAAPRYVNQRPVTVMEGKEKGTYQAGEHISDLSHLSAARIQRLIQMGIYAQEENSDVSNSQ